MAASVPLSARDYKPQSVRSLVGQSPPIDLSIPYDDTWLCGKHAVITGGASGFGAGFALRWAKAGASIVIADINEKALMKTVANIRTAAGHDKVWSVHCNVVDWDDQVRLFKEAVRLSPHGGIDIVVPNAGIGPPETFHKPELVTSNYDENASIVAKPDLTTLNVNLTGVMYTSHLALHYLKINPQSPISHKAATPNLGQFKRDRLLLLIGSIASLCPVPSFTEYCVSKHAALGLFRTLRATVFVEGIRVNMLCPYFIKTGILPASARLGLAGVGVGSADDVVEAATRLAADQRILGRALIVGPKVMVMENSMTGEYEFTGVFDEAGQSISLNSNGDIMPGSQKTNHLLGDPTGTPDPKESSWRTNPHVKFMWEAYADDFEETEVAMRRFMRVLNLNAAVKGIQGVLFDVFDAIKYLLTNK